MLRIEKSIEINQPIVKVFEFVRNPENEPLWRTEIYESQLASEAPFGVGSKINQTVHFLGRNIEGSAEITVYEPNQNFSWKLICGPIPGEGHNIFEDLGEGQTRYTISTEFDVGGFFKLAEPIVGRTTRRQVEANLATLKDLLEADADNGE